MDHSSRILEVTEQASLATQVLANVQHMTELGIFYGQHGIDRSLSLEHLCTSSADMGGEGAVGTVLEGTLLAAVGKAVRVMNAGDWLICPPSVSHCEFRVSAESSHRVAWFCPDTSGHVLGESSYSREEGCLLSVCQPLEPAADVRKAMSDILGAPNQPAATLRIHLLRLIAGWLDMLQNSAGIPAVQEQPFVGQIRNAISQSEACLVSVQYLARKMGVSRCHLSRIFRNNTGQTLRQTLHNARFERAKRYLADPSLSIKEIAYLIGFSKPQHFTRAFRRETGTSPKVFRLQQNDRDDHA